MRYDNQLWWYNYLVNCGICWTELHLWPADSVRSTRFLDRETRLWLSPFRLSYPNARFRFLSTPRGSWVKRRSSSRLKMPLKHNQSPNKALALRAPLKTLQSQLLNQCSRSMDLSQRVPSRRDSVIGRSKENALIFELLSMFVVIKWV